MRHEHLRATTAVAILLSLPLSGSAAIDDALTPATRSAGDLHLGLRYSKEPQFAGTYEGRVVSVRDGRLWYLRGSGGLSEPLTPLGGDVYALAAARLRFSESGGAVTLSVKSQPLFLPRGVARIVARLADRKEGRRRASRL
jgi:hypothetical protein